METMLNRTITDFIEFLFGKMDKLCRTTVILKQSWPAIPESADGGSKLDAVETRLAGILISMAG